MCKIVGCNKPVRYPSLNVCYMHYKRFWRHGSFDYSPKYTRIMNGGISKNGYKRVTRDGVRMLEHRYIVQCKIGRKLNNNEVVHHINGNKLDNSIDNLMVLTQSEHINKFHLKRPLINWIKISVPNKTNRWHPNKNEFCLIDACSNKTRTRGLCQKHYVSFHRYSASI